MSDFEDLGLNGVELLTATQIRLTEQSCFASGVSTGIDCVWKRMCRTSFTGIWCHLHAILSVFRISSPYFAHFVAHFTSPRVV